ncbi:hypothetical protein ACFQZW_06320 [Lutibacter aestuarii]|uniref:Lipoprotein n=1 Tax=Lutibacter aestuarii TaxID=861111 RepID=A0ABW2Z6B5_9FLAO
MKTFIYLFIVLTTLYSSCNNQNSKNLEINYKAQTRGFNYEIHLKNDTLQINNDNIIKKIKLHKTQHSQITNLVNLIDFKEIKNNISTDEFAVDRAIKGKFKLKFNNQVYEYELDHHNLPKSIQQLFTTLEQTIK